MYVISRRLAAEALGTAFLLATVVGSGIMGESLADGNVSLALLANTLATGAILIVIILIFGPISGAHFNPAVSVAFALRRELPWRLLPAYLAAQVIGALIGVAAAHGMFDLAPLTLSSTPRTGPALWWSEVVATFGLVATILGCLRARADAVPYAVGLYIAAGYWFTASTSFANPAVTVARSFTDTFSGILPAHAPAFIAAELIGAVLAVGALAWFYKPASASNPARAENIPANIGR